MVAGIRHATWRAALVGSLLLCAHGQAHGQVPFSGQWKAGATATNVVVDSWGPDCGQQPASSRSGGGGLVRIEQQGDVLTIVGKQRVIRSNACWSLNPAMRKVSSGRNGDVWTTRCRTPAQDPREESGTYTLKALTPERLLYQDVSRFNWQLKRSRCSASITTVQTLVRQATDEAPAPPALPPIDEAPRAAADDPAPPKKTRQTASPACLPGAPATLGLTPRTAQVELGGRVCFHARVRDAAGCPLPDARVSWQLRSEAGLKGSLQQGCFRAGERAAESEGELEVVARAKGLTAIATVQVAAEDLSALLARRLGAGALTGEAEAPAQPPQALPAATPQARVATRTVQAPAVEQNPEIWWIAGSLLMLGGVALLLVRRRATLRSALARAGEQATASMDSAASRAAMDSASRAQMDSAARTEIGSASRSETGSASRTEANAPRASSGSEPQPAGGFICPRCRRGFAGPGHCPDDGAALTAYAEFARAAAAQRDSRMRCPNCGARYPADTAFCGVDGSALERSD